MGTRDDRTGRYLERLDRHLGTLAGERARRAFLDAQIAVWEGRYARFVASDGASEPPGEWPPPQAADFLLTIAALAERRASRACAEAAAVTASPRCMHDGLAGRLR